MSCVEVRAINKYPAQNSIQSENQKEVSDMTEKPVEEHMGANDYKEFFKKVFEIAESRRLASEKPKN